MNADAEVWIAPAADGKYDVMFGLTSYGFDKYQCHFTGTFSAGADGLVARGVHNTDSEFDDTIDDGIRIMRTGQTLAVSQPAPASGDGPPWVCPHVTALTGPLFHTGLKADQAYRLK